MSKKNGRPECPKQAKRSWFRFKFPTHNAYGITTTTTKNKKKERKTEKEKERERVKKGIRIDKEKTLVNKEKKVTDQN